MLESANAIANTSTPNLVDGTVGSWRRTDAFAKENIPDLVWKTTLWHTQAFAELIVPEETWCALLHLFALAYAGFWIPILVWWTNLRNFTFTSTGLRVPYLVHRADVCLRA